MKRVDLPVQIAAAWPLLAALTGPYVRSPASFSEESLVLPRWLAAHYPFHRCKLSLTSGIARSIQLPIRNQRHRRHVSQEFRLGLVSPIGQDGHMDGYERTSKWTLFRPEWTRVDTKSGH